MNRGNSSQSGGSLRSSRSDRSSDSSLSRSESIDDQQNHIEKKTHQNISNNVQQNHVIEKPVEITVENSPDLNPSTKQQNHQNNSLQVDQQNADKPTKHNSQFGQKEKSHLKPPSHLEHSHHSSFKELVDINEEINPEAPVEKQIELPHEEEEDEQQRQCETPFCLQTRSHIVDLKSIIDYVETNLEFGLTSTEAAIRLEKYGPNELKTESRFKTLKILLHHIFNFMNLVLFVGFCIALGVQYWIDAGVVGIVIIINIIIGFSQEIKSEKTMQSLQKLSSSSCHVLRDGQICDVPSSELVLGDIVCLKEGDQIPADLRLFDVNNLESDEAILTGESEPVVKNCSRDIQNSMTEKTSIGDRLNMAYSGTTVTKGKGKGIVIATGMYTEIGAIAKKLTKTKKNIPKIQKKMNTLGGLLVILGFICTVTVFVAGGLHGTLDWFPEGLQAGVSVLVAIIPEGLVPVLTIAMTFGVIKMAKQHAIVRKLTALETLGNVTDICSDKTGTITEGRMTAIYMWLTDSEEYSITGSGVSPYGQFINMKNNEKLKRNEMSYCLSMALRTGSLCNTASVQHRKHLDSAYQHKSKQRKNKIKEGKWKATGNPTEIALQVLAMKMNMGKKQLIEREDFVSKLVTEYAFDSTIKRMSVIYRSIENQNGSGCQDGNKSIENAGNNDKEYFVLTKGAPEQILNICSRHVDEQNEITDITSEKIKEIRYQNEKFANEGLRVLALAFKKISHNQIRNEFQTDLSHDYDESEFFKSHREDMEKDLVFVGLVGIQDPPREGIMESIQLCHEAGITVRMLTGDHQSTAVAIARQVGILQSEQDEKLFMTANEFEDEDHQEEEPKKDYQKYKFLPLVIARCSPESKVKMVKLLHDRKRQVAMTGDGVNDAPCLKSSDIGISMGINGAEVTKQISDIVLTDDNFNTIVSAIKEGRRIFDSIRKFVIHLLSGNVAEIVLLVISVLAGLNLPLNATQILFLNMITGTGPAIGLSVEPAKRGIMDRKKYSVQQNLFNFETIVDILIFGTLMGILGLINFILMTQVFDQKSLKEAQGVTFATITTLLLLHAYNCRDQRRPFFVDSFYKSYFLHFMVFFGFALTVATIYIPWINSEVFKQQGITAEEWLLVLAAAVIFMTGSEIYKFIKRMIWISYLKWNKSDDEEFYFTESDEEEENAEEQEMQELPIQDNYKDDPNNNTKHNNIEQQNHTNQSSNHPQPSYENKV